MPLTPIKVRFPVLTLPQNYGGLRAVVLFSKEVRSEPFVVYSTCIDEKGRVHFDIPLAAAELRKAAEKPATLMEVADDNAAPAIVVPSRG